MSETKNDPQQAISFANGLLLPSMNAYSGSSESLSTSDGAAAKDINQILAQTKKVMNTFETSLQADAKNLISISDAYERANQAMIDVVTHG
jgi:hypothetical protein